jgi:hypothetical protein
MRIYLTHCTGIKDDRLKETGTAVAPNALYTSMPIQRFIARCHIKNVKWAIFSDLYGVWHPHQKHTWYDKHPDTVTEEEMKQLVRDFDEELQDFSEIWFYNNPSWFHRLYKMLVKRSSLSNRITLFSRLKEIV